MTLQTKRIILAVLSATFLLSLVFVQWMEVARKREEVGITTAAVHVPESSDACVGCHGQSTPGIIDHWKGSTHAQKGVGCFECHKATDGEADAFHHYGSVIATVVTPKDCGVCHGDVATEFGGSHHAAAGNILASLDNFLAGTIEGARAPFDPHAPTPGRPTQPVDGNAAAIVGCLQCHGSKIGLRTTDGGTITVDDLAPGPDGKPTKPALLEKVMRDDLGRPMLDRATWPNTGIGRINLDGSLGSCSACHSRHDFSPRRARQPESCGKCHLGPDHPQKEVYEESKHGVAFRDLKDRMNLDGKTWILGKDYSQAPTCATCHMSGHSRNGGKVTHDPGERISWTNRPPVSLVMDTDARHGIVTEADPAKRRALITDTAGAKRGRMKDVCSHCHTGEFANAFYEQYDSFVVLYNEKFARPGLAIMDALGKAGLVTKVQFDDEIEWTWFKLWHHEGRRARHGASMMAPDYAQWHGMFEVGERFYQGLVPQARRLIREGVEAGHKEEAGAAEAVLDEILRRPEHASAVARGTAPRDPSAPAPAAPTPATVPVPGAKPR